MIIVIMPSIQVLKPYSKTLSSTRSCSCQVLGLALTFVFTTSCARVSRPRSRYANFVDFILDVAHRRFASVLELQLSKAYLGRRLGKRFQGLRLRCVAAVLLAITGSCTVGTVGSGGCACAAHLGQNPLGSGWLQLSCRPRERRTNLHSCA